MFRRIITLSLVWVTFLNAFALASPVTVVRGYYIGIEVSIDRKGGPGHVAVRYMMRPEPKLSANDLTVSYNSAQVKGENGQEKKTGTIILRSGYDYGNYNNRRYTTSIFAFEVTAEEWISGFSRVKGMIGEASSEDWRNNRYYFAEEYAAYSIWGDDLSAFDPSVPGENCFSMASNWLAASGVDALANIIEDAAFSEDEASANYISDILIKDQRATCLKP